QPLSLRESPAPAPEEVLARAQTMTERIRNKFEALYQRIVKAKKLQGFVMKAVERVEEKNRGQLQQTLASLEEKTKVLLDKMKKTKKIKSRRGKVLVLNEDLRAMQLGMQQLLLYRDDTMDRSEGKRLQRGIASIQRMLEKAQKLQEAQEAYTQEMQRAQGLAKAQVALELMSSDVA